MIGKGSNPPPPSDWIDPLRFDGSDEAPAAARARVLERLQADFAAGVTAPDLPRAPLATLGRIANRWAVVTFALGAATGAGVHAWLQHPRPDRVVYVDRPVVLPPPAAAPVSPAAPPAKPPARARPSGSRRDLAAERALLDSGQRALRAGDFAAAQRAIDAHARRFPDGILAEEREALAVRTLVAAGRREEAQRRAAAFRERFPDGLFRPSIETNDAPGEIP